MNKHQEVAIKDHCRLAGETMQRKFGYVVGNVSIILTVNSGYE
jgi:hypothetical protein